MTLLRIYLRGREWPIGIPHATTAHAVGTVMWWTEQFGRLPPEARPAKAWLIARDSAETVVNAVGVDEQVHTVPIAYIDPREVVALHVVEVQE